jgi:hypothetical protein
MTKKIFKLMVLMLIVGLTSANVKGQNLKDFYIPSQSNYNKASFYTPGKNGERTEMTRVIYYTDNSDGTFDLLDAHMFQGQPSAIVTQTVKFTANEVKLVKTVSTTMFETNKKQTYDPPKTLLKMPAAGQTATWTTPGEGGDEPTKYTSSWTTVTVDGQSKKAIKVISQYTGWKSKTVLYYVEGIGLMKTDFVDENGATKPFEKFDGLSYEATTR